MNTIPDDILKIIINFLKVSEMSVFGGVSRRVKKIVNTFLLKSSYIHNNKFNEFKIESYRMNFTEDTSKHLRFPAINYRMTEIASICFSDNHKYITIYPTYILSIDTVNGFTIAVFIIDDYLESITIGDSQYSLCITNTSVNVDKTDDNNYLNNNKVKTDKLYYVTQILQFVRIIFPQLDQSIQTYVYGKTYELSRTYYPQYGQHCQHYQHGQHCQHYQHDDEYEHVFDMINRAINACSKLSF